MNVIVNADDLGMSMAVNDAIFAAFDAGLLKSASILVHGPAFADAVARLRDRPGLALGLHLDSTEFAPSTGPLYERWRRQHDRALDAGLTLDHYDSHQHIHLRWASLPALRRLCAETGVGRVRGRSLAYGQALRSRLWRATVRNFAAIPDHYYAMSRYVERCAPAHAGWTEIMVHPGNPHHARYADEMQALALLSPQWTLGRFADLG